MKSLRILFSFFLLVSVALAGGEKLVGVWKSDKEKTLIAMKRITMRLTPDQYAQLDALLGKMVITYDGKVATWTLGNESGSRAYKVASEVAPMLLLESRHPKTKLIEQTMIRFAGEDEYWICDTRFPGIEECFVRQKTETPPAPPIDFSAP